MTDALQSTLDIQTTDRNSEFFLYQEPLPNPQSGEEEPVTFVVIPGITGLHHVDAAIALLFQTAHKGKLSWELFAAALNYAELRPAATDVADRTRRIARRGSKKSLWEAIKREQGREFLAEGWPGTLIDQKIRQLTDSLRDNVDQACAFAEFGDGEYNQPVRSVPGLADRGADWAQAVLEEKISYDGFVAKLLSVAQAGDANLHPFLGSRVIHRALEALFQATLEEVEEQFPANWQQISTPGCGLHDFFYRIPESGTAGALPLWPYLNDEEDGIVFHAPGPVEFAVNQLKSPSARELLAIAAFSPEVLPKTFRGIAAAASVEAEFVLTDTRAVDALDRRVYLDEESLLDPLNTTPTKGRREDFIQFFEHECGLDSREAAILYDTGSRTAFAKDLAGDEVGEARISQIKRQALRKVQRCVQDNPDALVRLLQLCGQQPPRQTGRTPQVE